MNPKRRQRIDAFLREEIANILRTEVRDPRIGFASVIQVSVSPELDVATVGISVLGTEAQQRTTMRGIEAAAKHIQTLLGRRIHFRRTPELRFVLDESIQRAMAMDDLIRKARTEDEDAAHQRAERYEAEPAADAPG